LLLVSPEYNNGLAGVAKSAIEWLSRPPADIARACSAASRWLAYVSARKRPK
jgi:NAD(P)H-dependent FMN reductase